MLQQAPRREAGTGENNFRRKMLLSLAFLLIAFGVVVVKNRELWFGADDTNEAEEASPATVPSSAAQPPVAPVAQVKKAVVAKASAKPVVAKPAAKQAVIATSPAVLPPLEIEVVGGGTHHPVHPDNAVKVETLTGAESRAASATAAEWGSAANAAERVRMSSDKPPAELKPAYASYPLLAEQMKVQGSVLLQAFIGADGVIQELRVLSGPPILASAAREAALQWRFKPYIQNGQPVETQAKITVNFTIRIFDDETRDHHTAHRNGGAPVNPQPANPGY